MPGEAGAPATIDTRPGISIVCHPLGAGPVPTILMLHGFASSAQQNWMRSGWSLALAKAGLSAIAIDLPGHGSSSRPHTPESYSLDLLVDDVIAVLEHEGMTTAHVLGYSFGARLGWELGVRHPERTLDLVLGGLPAREPLRDFRLDEVIAHAESGIPVADPFTAGFVAMAEAIPGADLLALTAFAAAQQGLPPIVDGPAPAAPMLLVTGSDDALASGSRLLAAPDAPFVELPGRTHANAITSRVFKESAIEFFAQHPDRSSDR